MDFLDPRLKRSYNIRLIVGYVLMALVVALGSLILIYGAYGYGINTKTGQIIQNGLLFIDSQPGGAQIYLNNQDQKRATAVRLVLPAGDYSLQLKKTGYHDWQRSFTLDEHSIARYTYPLLIPIQPVKAVVKNYAAMPPAMTQSPDKRWLLIQTQSTGFEQFDANDPVKAPVNLSLAPSLLSDSGLSGSLVVQEWAADNVHVLLKHDYAGGTDFILFNRDKPGDSINLNKTFNAAPSQVVLKNKRIDQFYFYDQTAQTIRVASTGQASLSSPILSQVLAFKPYGSELMAYVTAKGATAGKVQGRIWQNGKTYKLDEFKSGQRYVVDLAQYNNHWYYLASSDAEPRINIYKDPMIVLSQSKPGRPLPFAALNQAGADMLSFSPSFRFVAAEKGQSFSVYDLETQSTYNYSLQSPVATPLQWLDASHLIGTIGGLVFIADYDSLNAQSPIATSQPDGGFLSRNQNHLLTFTANPTTGGFDLVNMDMRAGSDLPKQP